MGRTLPLAFSALLIPLLVAGTGDAEAQVPEPLEVGAMAPDFELPGATRHGVLAEPISLRDYEGETVVLSFFFRARTRG